MTEGFGLGIGIGTSGYSQQFGTTEVWKYNIDTKLWSAVKGMPIHTIVRGRFVMRDRGLMAETRGHGRSVHTLQQMPVPISFATWHATRHTVNLGRF